MSEHRNGEVLTAFLLGGVIGAALGILFAPASGKVTRERLNDWLEEKGENAKEALEKLESEIKKKKEQLMKN
ncbi:MAG: YtxH domain-containing protein [Elusimicrobia bacterium]|nr:YtxH domain-containing protein [Elusimicrobiota bacterium]